MFLNLLAGGAGSAFARDDDSADTQRAEALFHGGLPVPTVRGDGVWCATGPGCDPPDGRGQLCCIGRVSDMELVIDDDAVVVVDDLPLVAELDGFTEAALGDRARIAVMQTDHPGGSVRGDPGDPLPRCAAI